MTKTTVISEFKIVKVEWGKRPLASDGLLQEMVDQALREVLNADSN